MMIHIYCQEDGTVMKAYRDMNAAWDYAEDHGGFVVSVTIEEDK
jgi:hypothetical protein